MFNGSIHRKLDAILAGIDDIRRRLDGAAEKETLMAGTLQDVVNAVNNEKTVDAGILTLVGQLVAQVAAANAGQNPQIDAILAQIQANDAVLAQAVQQGTAALPASPPSPPPTVVAPPAVPATPPAGTP